MVEESSQVVCPITTKLMLDEDEETKEPLVQVHRNLVTKLKPHQVDGKDTMHKEFWIGRSWRKKNKQSKPEVLGTDVSYRVCFVSLSGVQFMWDCCCESVKKIEKSSGSGCILAHCMGLGKTLQVSYLPYIVCSFSLLYKLHQLCNAMFLAAPNVQKWPPVEL